MPPLPPSPARVVLDREFFAIRSQILTLAASLDRLERASGCSELHADERLVQLRAAVDRLVQPGPDRAADIQLIFSDPYQDDWRSRLNIPTL